MDAKTVDNKSAPGESSKSHRTETIDYSDEVHAVRSKALRVILIGLGTFTFALGIIGVFLPVLPTTPFLLLSAFFYGRSSARFYNWLMNNRIFGNYIHEWRNTRSIRFHIKVIAITLIVLTMGSSIIWFVPYLAARVAIGLVGVTLILYLLRIKTNWGD